MPNKDLLKIICICSFIVGAIIGILPLIPAFVQIAFVLIMFFVAPFILIYLYKLKLIKDLSMEKSLIIGAISGAVGFVGFTVSYMPIAFLLNLLFKIQSYIWIKVLFFNFGFLIPFIILTALLCGMLNAFSTFLTIYFYTLLQNRK
jgi:hypothetical protein